MMDYMEEVFAQVAMAANGSEKATFQEKEIQFKAPFKRITMCGSIKEKTGVDPLEATEKELGELCLKHGVEVTAASLIDRVLHHCRIVNIRGNSFRMRQHADLSEALLTHAEEEAKPSPQKRRKTRKEIPTN